jgi:L-threonylcarbamoyladenylate synthase
VVAFPTDTVYGLGAAAGDELAQKRIFAMKNRPVGMPLILMAAARSQLAGWVHVDSRAEEFISRWWPGPLTLILHSPGGGTLGVRIPNHEVALELLRASGPLMTTSANLHGKDPAMTAKEAAELPGLAAILDGGRAPGGTASTVLDLTGPEPHILREGAILAGDLLGPPPPRAG